jgi:hypothetical protein
MPAVIAQLPQPDYQILVAGLKQVYTQLEWFQNVPHPAQEIVALCNLIKALTNKVDAVQATVYGLWNDIQSMKQVLVKSPLFLMIQI